MDGSATSATATPAALQGALPGMPQPIYRVSPTRLLTFLDCPRRYRFQYLDRPTPPKTPQRAHLSLGLSVHNALRDWWEVRRTPSEGARLLRRGWIDVGYRDAAQSQRWRERSAGQVESYLAGVDPEPEPAGVERTVAFLSGDLQVSGRIDRLDDRAGELVVVDYKTSRSVATRQDLSTSLPMALYAAAVWKMFRRATLRVEFHHVPTGAVVVHQHTPASLGRKVEEARSIAHDTRTADQDFAAHGAASQLFPARTGPLCGWCDFRAHCPQGQQAAPEKSSWAALDDAGE